MRQTNKYQFNLIDRDDPFSPDALNENAQKLETAMEDYKSEVGAELSAQTGQIAQVRAENCLYHLIGPVTKSSGNISVSLADIDMTAYHALLVFVHARAKSNASITISGTTLTVYPSFTGMFWLFNAGTGVGITGGGGYYHNSTTTGLNFNQYLTCTWDSIKTIASVEVEYFDIYGLKA